MIPIPSNTDKSIKSSSFQNMPNNRQTSHSLTKNTSENQILVESACKKCPFHNIRTEW